MYLPGVGPHKKELLSKELGVKSWGDLLAYFPYKYVDRSHDTIYIKDKSVEYRYKLLRDTVRKVRVDSVPVIREIEVVKEVKYIPWYAKALSALGVLTIAVLLLRLFR